MIIKINAKNRLLTLTTPNKYLYAQQNLKFYLHESLRWTTNKNELSNYYVTKPENFNTKFVFLLILTKLFVRPGDDGLHTIVLSALLQHEYKFA